ncbi:MULTISPECIES: anti-repressor SinI family protein [Bacillus]|uniref:DNA-binding transcriptional MerR regulator n=1 Tax=Bacillus capparidis TaxID=1840411 RepID=A0ABS4CQD1_9BACI|nr:MULTISPECIES: anti-repressor SinI family protein [Bacillus]MBP1079726.1 DNA-binding transcriptional MerR regulator [Bacillus capparidis]MED1095122.1 anti-repressor SinI family protein [Bacillus capparidis]
MSKEGQLHLDEEWIELIREALEAGISSQEIREFLIIRSSLPGIS